MQQFFLSVLLLKSSMKVKVYGKTFFFSMLSYFFRLFFFSSGMSCIKNGLKTHFLLEKEAQTFWTDPGSVATAYSADKIEIEVD